MANLTRIPFSDIIYTYTDEKEVKMSPEMTRFVESILIECKTKNNEMSLYKNIPVEYLPQIREYFNEKNIKIQVRYRGSRTNPLDRRYRTQRMQDCVKQFADRFSVYRRRT